MQRRRRQFSCLNLIKGACQVVVETSLFWMVVAALTIVEPILCSYNVHSLYQQMVLLISSVFYVIQLIGVATIEWDKILHYERLFQTSTSRFRSTKSVMTEQSMTVVNMYKFFTAEGEYMFEFCCLAGGWCTIFRNPGLAVLRCFRVFRLLWYDDDADGVMIMILWWWYYLLLPISTSHPTKLHVLSHVVSRSLIILVISVFLMLIVYLLN